MNFISEIEFVKTVKLYVHKFNLTLIHPESREKKQLGVAVQSENEIPGDYEWHGVFTEALKAQKQYEPLRIDSICYSHTDKIK